MKKLIAILLAAVMAFSFAQITAFADEPTISYEEIDNAGTADLDYSAYDSIIVLIHSIDNSMYTDDSISALLDTVVDKDSLLTQNDIDSAVKSIAEAYSKLEKKTYSVEFFTIDSQDNIKSTKHTYSHGDVAEFQVTDTDEVVYKWVVSRGDIDSKLATTTDTVSLVITEDIVVTAFTDVKQEIKDQTQRVVFLASNGTPAAIVYTTDINNIDMPVAPSIPFYAFDEWVKLDDNTFQAKYTMSVECGDNNHVFTVTVVKPTCIMPGHVIFMCPCGEGFRTDYVDPTGHSYDDDHEFCLNGCGTINSKFDVEETYTPSDDNSTQPTKPSNDKEFVNGVDEGGYNNAVYMP